MGRRRELALVVAIALLVASLGGLAAAEELERCDASKRAGAIKSAVGGGESNLASGPPAGLQAAPGQEPAAGPAITIVVTSTADSGPGTLRQALQDAQSGDTITFDPVVFPPTAPASISITSALPDIHTSDLAIDASNAGVILDGSNVQGEWVGGLQIVSSDGNAIRGLQVSGFSGPGIAISGNAQRNVIGGDRAVGAGPHGQGNLLIHNANGVVLSSGGTSHNTLTGNLIGSDATGTADLGNRGHGIWITDGPHGNAIGPDNVIAHNGGAGIGVFELNTVLITISRNSIHDNGWRGIVLWGGSLLFAPTIYQFDLHAGMATGTTCHYCTVEIYSDDSDEGAVLEGQVTANGMGVFTLNKGAPFVGPNLTATVTEAAGDTSEFSLPTSGASRSLTLQAGNGLLAIHFHLKRSGELLDNRIGASLIGNRDPDRIDLYFYDMGVKRVRVAINHQEPEYVFWDRPEFEVSPQWDEAITRMADNGIKMNYLLTFWDKLTYPGGVGAPCARFKTEGEIQRYLEFVRFIVHHFKDRIQYYELWNEPDIANYCPKWIQVDDYINLVKRVVPVIREEYPGAKIVVGGVSSLMYPPADEYLYTILQSDIMPLVDVISWHPLYETSPEYETFYDYYYGYPSIVQRIKDLASAHGFHGEYLVDELSWTTPDVSNGREEMVYSRTVAAKYASRGIVMHLGMDVTVGVRTGAGYARPNLCTAMAGALPADLPVEIETTVTNTVTYTFSLPDDKHLVALWSDGIAAEYDPGITATLTLPGFADHAVTGIDVVHGFHQPVTAGEEDGDLVIRGLLVKDYPILLRLSPIGRVFLPAVSRTAVGS